jgi:hypothetical protein
VKMQAKVRWESSHKASKALLDALFDDIGIELPEIREAARKWAINLIAQDIELTMGELETLATAWQSGYTQALLNRGLIAGR